MEKTAFDAEAALLLESIVENGDTGGMMASAVKKKWTKFHKINGNTFRARLKRVRDKFLEKPTNNQSMSFVFYIYSY